MTTTWHAPPEVLARFATEPESLDEVSAASVEQHLLACADCRRLVASAADPAWLTASWDAVADVADRPRTSPVERLLGRMGVSPALARGVGATGGLQAAWGVAVVALAGGALAFGDRLRTETPFLTVAPLVPLLAVLIAFLPAADPAGEVATATPVHGAGLALWRTVAVLLPTLAVLAGAALFAPGAAGGAAWVLPGLALAAGSLALSTVWRPEVAAGGLAGAWMAGLTLVRLSSGRGVALADTALFAPAGQLVALLVTVVGVALVVARRDRFTTLEVMA